MNYWVFLLPLIAGVLAQLLKVFIDLARRDFTWHTFKKYGGMPSSHSAFVFGLLAEVAIIDGFYSTTFAIALVLTLLIIRDATGYRRDMDSHAKAINDIVEQLPDKKQTTLPHLEETIGHTPLQALAGGIIGIAVVLVGNLLI